MSREQTPLDGQIRPIPSAIATPDVVNPASTASNRRKSGRAGGEMGGSAAVAGRALSMREFFEAGGRAYEVYLSYQDRQPLPDSPGPVLQSRCALSSPTKDNRKQLGVDKLPPQIPEVASKTFGNGGTTTSPSVLTVVHLTATCGSPGYAQAQTGQRLSASVPVTSPCPKDSGASCAYVAADVIDRVIASRLCRQNDTGYVLTDDVFGRKDEAERPIKGVFAPLSTLSQTPPTDPPIASSSPSTVSSIGPLPTTSATLSSTTSCTSPMENVDGRPSNVVYLTDSFSKRKHTADKDPELAAVDLSRKRVKSADNDQCEAGKQTNAWPKEAPHIDRQKAAKNEADGKGVTRHPIAGIVPKVVYQSATIFSDVTLWSVDQVVRFVANVQGCREYAEIFRQEEIDGACLIRLSESHLLNVIQMKLGPALRLRQAIASLCSLDAI